MSFFIRFGLQDFTFDGETFRIEDLTKRVVNRPVEFFNQVYFQDYYIVRGTRPDILAHTLYGDVNYWWAFFVVNNITANDWPMDDKDLELRIEEEYTAFELESRSRSRNADGQLIEGYRPKFTRVDGQLISHHYDPTAEVTSYSTRVAFDGMQFANDSTKESVKNRLFAENEEKRTIKIIKAGLIRQFAEDFFSKLN